MVFHHFQYQSRPRWYIPHFRHAHVLLGVYMASKTQGCDMQMSHIYHFCVSSVQAGLYMFIYDIETSIWIY
jgi:Uri superfamily endonuclease